jgi:hypothetical protein
MIDTEKKAYPITLLCEVMQVSRPGYYSWCTREKSARQKEYENLIPVVQEAHKNIKGDLRGSTNFGRSQGTRNYLWPRQGQDSDEIGRYLCEAEKEI